MIDWITCLIPCIHFPLNSGALVKIDEHGLIQWESLSWTTVEGSFSSKIKVFSTGHLDDQGRATYLKISGNPAKFLQGHNIFGTDDLSRLMVLFTNRIFDILGIAPLLSDLKAIREGNYSLSRIDINYGFRLDTRTDVLSWIRAAEHKSYTRAGKSSRKGGTIYFGQKSRRWSLKFYSKGEEVESNKKHHFLLNDDLRKYADTILRAELTLRSLELRELNLYMANTLTQPVIQKIYGQYLGKLQMSAQQYLPNQVFLSLPRRLQSTYALWKEGIDLKKTMSERNYYYHRSGLLKYGIDINHLPDSITKLDNVVPLIRVLEAKPAEIPQWAYDKKLIAC